jgi:hypothetical protein
MTMANKVTDPVEREELHKLYTDLQEIVYNIEAIIRRRDGFEAAKAYWLGGIKSSTNDDEYASGGNPTFKSFLQDHGIADEEGNFIELPDEDDECDDEELDTDVDNEVPTV